MLRSPNGSPYARLEGLFRRLTVLFSFLFILLFVRIAWQRLHYPFEVDRMESGMLTSVWRLRHGFALYSPPSLTWAPFLYAPLFFYISAMVTKIVGINYAALRLVSLLATIGSFSLIFTLVYTETKRSFAPALFSVGLFAALYPFVLAWYDVGRVDSLSLFFFLAALLATRRTNPWIAAPLWTLAFLTKQTFLPIGFAAFLIDWPRPRRMITGMLAYALLIIASVVWLQHTTSGWFRYYAFGTGGVIHWSFRTAVMFPFADVLAPLPIACALIAAAALFTRWNLHEPDGSFFTIVTLLLLVAIGYVRAHVGANLNAVIPLYAWLTILAGIALDRLLQSLHSPQPSPSTAAGFSAALWLLAMLQLASHLYRPAEVQTGNLAARERFLDALRATPGDVWVVDHSYDAILAGKPLHADMDALDAVLGRKYLPALKELDELASSGHLTAVVLDRGPDAYEPQGLFTRRPFSSIYRLRAASPGAGAPGDRDQPVLTLLPCKPEVVSNSLTDLSTGFIDPSACR